jgi:hypothetical protein
VGDVAKVEHAPAPLLVSGTVIVPVMPLGTGLTVGDAPSCNPFGPTGVPGTTPSDEVAPSEGMAVPTWASVELHHNKGPTVTMMSNGRMVCTPITAERLRAAAMFSLAMFFLMAVDRGRIVSAVAPRSTFP